MVANITVWETICVPCVSACFNLYQPSKADYKFTCPGCWRLRLQQLGWFTLTITAPVSDCCQYVCIQYLMKLTFCCCVVLRNDKILWQLVKNMASQWTLKLKVCWYFIQIKIRANTISEEYHQKLNKLTLFIIFFFFLFLLCFSLILLFSLLLI